MLEKANFIKVNNSRLFYSLTGEGEPVVFLHSGFTDHRIWEYQMEAFARQYEVVSYDLKGYGQSDLPLGPFSNPEDLKALLEALDMKQVSLVGSSLGGGVAIDYALAYPERVKCLVLVGSGLKDYPCPDDYMTQIIELSGIVQMQGIEAGIEHIITAPSWDYFFPSSNRPEARAKVVQAVRDSVSVFRWNPLWDCSINPAAERLGEIRCPALIVTGTRDSQYVLQIADYLQSGIKQATRIMMEDCCHLPYVEKPEEFNKIVMDFIKNCCA